MSRWQLLVYACAHFGKSLMWQASGLAFAFYLTEVIGFAPTAMGWLLGGSLALNAVMDLVLGWALRTRVQSIGSAGLAQARGAIAATAAFAVFAGCALLPVAWRVVAATASLLAFRLAYSAVDVPQNAILALAASSDSDRIRISATRYAAAGVSLIALSLALAPWLTTPIAETRASAFLCIGLVIAACALAGSFALFAVTRGATTAAVLSETAQAPREVRIPYALILVSIVAFSGLAPIFSKLQAYLAAFGLHPTIGTWFLPAVAMGQVAGQWGWWILGRRLGLLGFYRTTATVLVLACTVFAVCALLGGPAALLGAAVYGAASSGLLMAIWAWLAAAAAEPGATTLRFGLFTFCSKLAQAAGLTVIGYVLAQVPYKSPGGGEALIILVASAPAVAAGLCLMISIVASRRSRLSLAKAETVRA